MANLNLKSEKQIQAEMLSVLVSNLGLNDLNPGSVIDVLTQAAAQQDFNIHYAIAQISRLTNINNVKGSDLDLRAAEFGLTRRQAANATGLVTIQRPVGFVKVSLTFYAGLPSPVAGNTEINLTSTNALLGTSGDLIIGRGTPNEETVSYSTAPINVGDYYTLTLDSPLLNNHNTLESIILKQGDDETILQGTIIRTPATSVTAEIQFQLDNDAILLAGEAELSGVEVTALEPGVVGNISALAINGESGFITAPFIGARVNNPAKFTTGQNRESDDSLRDRIKSAGDLLTKGVKNAIETAITGLVDPETAKRVVSVSVVPPIEEVGPVKIYIDDGTGFEPDFTNVAYEIVRGQAAGGEQRLQLDNFPVNKASIETNNSEFYNFSGGTAVLILEVGGVQETITFNSSDFANPAQGTAEELVTLINDRSLLVEARTSQNGSKIMLTAKAETNESIQVIGGAANSILGFPTNLTETISLYINDKKLTKDGTTANVVSQNTAPFDLSSIGAYPHTLTIVVDGKSVNTQTATINSIDVLDPAAVTAAEIAAVINRDIAGAIATAINNGANVRIESNTKLSASSKIQVTGGTANDSTDGLNFVTTEQIGSNNDFLFNRELGIIELQETLLVGDILTVGTLYSNASLRAQIAENYAPGSGSTLIVSIDGGSDQTITFDASFASPQSAATVAAFINNEEFGLKGGKAVVRTVLNESYVEIQSNTLSNGTIEIKSSSTGNSAFGFITNTVASSQAPTTAYVESVTGPYNFRPNDTLLMIVDQNADTSFTVPMTYGSSVSTDNTADTFEALALSDIFDSYEDQILNYNIAFTSGANVSSEDIASITNAGGSTYTILFDTTPTNFADFSIGDFIRVENNSDASNNGTFVITSIGVDSVNVTNTAGVINLTVSGTGTLMQKRQITSYDNVTGEIEVDSVFANVPAIGDTFVVIPTSVNNVVSYLNNLKITSVSQYANINSSSQGSKIQISSKNPGSAGAIQITGGLANAQLQFTTTLSVGTVGYSYATGLLDLVHKTVYGDDTDLVAYPGVGAAGVIFHILAPTVRDVSVTLELTLDDGVTITSVTSQVLSAVSGYINALKIGEDVVLEEIRAAVIAISGIYDVELSQPLDNITIADNELARISSSNIIIG